MNIEDLIESDTNRRRPFNKRYSAEQVACYTADLTRVLDLEKEGRPRPALADLLKFFSDEYGISVAHSTLTTHLNKLSEGKKLW